MVIASNNSTYIDAVGLYKFKLLYVNACKGYRKVYFEKGSKSIP